MTLKADSFLARFIAMNALLVAATFPDVSLWWLTEIERFLRSGRRRWIIRAGRRSGKSTTLCRLAVAWALWGDWYVPLGDTAIVAIVSINKDEASSRLKTIADILTALGIPFERRGEEIQTARGVVFKVFAGTTSATVGFTSILVLGDEVARWENRDHSANPAQQVIGGLAPTMATVADAFMVLSSAPWSTDDFHAKQFDLGETEFQITSFAETWLANPTLTEAATHALEPHEGTWLREYAAQPSDVVTSNWFGETALALAFTDEPLPRFRSDVRYTIACDPAFSNDRFGWAVVSSTAAHDPVTLERDIGRVTRVHESGAWKPDRSPREMARRLKVDVCSRYRVTKVFADQHHGESWKELARDVNLNIEIVGWTGGEGDGSKSDRYKKTRLHMLEGALRIPRDADLLREFRSVRGVLLPSGGERIEVPRTSQGHGDRVASIVLATSLALEKSPQRPVSSMTTFERLERKRNRARIGSMFEAPFTPDEIDEPPVDADFAKVLSQLHSAGVSESQARDAAILLSSRSATVFLGGRSHELATRTALRAKLDSDCSKPSVSEILRSLHL